MSFSFVILDPFNEILMIKRIKRRCKLKKKMRKTIDDLLRISSLCINFEGCPTLFFTIIAFFLEDFSRSYKSSARVLYKDIIFIHHGKCNVPSAEIKIPLNQCIAVFPMQ
jgi:hypothetical protein